MERIINSDTTAINHKTSVSNFNARATNNDKTDGIYSSFWSFNQESRLDRRILILILELKIKIVLSLCFLFLPRYFQSVVSIHHERKTKAVVVSVND